MHTLLRCFFASVALLANAQLHAESTSIQAVTQQVLGMSEWVADTEQCPADFVPSYELQTQSEQNPCTPGRLERCFIECMAESANACYWLAQEIQANHGEQLAAEVLFQRSCRLGVVSGCTNRAAGMLSDDGENASVHLCSVRTFSKGCAADDPWACTMYGLQLSKGQGVPKDIHFAIAALRKSCRYGLHDSACTHADALQKQLLREIAVETGLISKEKSAP